MALCSECKKNTAVVFINKVVDNKPSVEGLCLACAKKRGINPLSSLMKQYGASDEEIENLNTQFDDIINSMDNLNDSDSNMFSGMVDEMMDGMSPDGMPLDSEPGNTPVDAFTRMFDKLISSMGNRPINGTYEDDNSKESSTTTKEKEPKKKEKKKRYLDTFGTNLTKKAKEGKIDKLVGRDQELERLTQILNRRNKNNPCLIGEPGVGKTAIANGLALKIAEGDVPEKLVDYEVYLLDMTAMVAGTQKRV